MASIFTYDPNPPRASSPWTNSGISTPSAQQTRERISPTSIDRQPTPISLDGPPVVEVDGTSTKLEAEPQEGPIEYKLHLLLLPRSISNVQGGLVLSGSNHSKLEKSGRSASESGHGRHDPLNSCSASEASLTSTQLSSSPNRSRQQRLEQLTTQLLWRLQQSSPYHASTRMKWTPPSFTREDATTRTAHWPTTLVPGLEESTGALYEIGVTDDGALIGLPDDMMSESLETLRIMASSLGCSVEILRMISVGESEYDLSSKTSQKREQAQPKRLWVAEAFVKPNLSLCSPSGAPSQRQDHVDVSNQALHKTRRQNKLNKAVSRSRSKQIRVSLTGATMSGKSSLLGTLSTATLDNGRGKSRLSLLKHKHELASGVTSSIAQELIGYHDVTQQSEKDWTAEVINFETGNVSSWNDVHDSTGSGRLVLLTDCAGNPRYRRTAIRGLIGWAPHWTLLCIPADDVEDTTGRSGSTPAPEEVLGPAAADIDLSAAYLDLCLRLHLPLVVVITKLDLASKQGLRLTLAKLLSTLKAANRKPSILPGSGPPISGQVLSRTTSAALGDAANLKSDLQRNPRETVPIVLTSALNGTGVATLHALLHELPVPDPVDAKPLAQALSPIDASSTVLFHVEDEYHPTTRQVKSPADLHDINSSATILGGHLQRGTVSIGDELLLGPFPLDRPTGDSEDSDHAINARIRPSTVTTSHSFPGALHRVNSLRLGAEQEWRQVQIASIRNLRQPVQSLTTGQVGTLGVVPLSGPISDSAMAMIRRGMVLTTGRPRARQTFVAEFARRDMENLAVGTTVLVYCASVRATAKIIAARMPDDTCEPALHGRHDKQRGGLGEDDGGAAALEFGFGFGFEIGKDDSGPDSGGEGGSLLVSFRFDHSREHVETGVQVLIVEAGAGVYGGHKRGEKGVVAGLGGFVGTVVEGD
ncbi:MAG: hypothetical protein M1822_004645 [Bathelium mastoideum]|nr:MAG: hypothetical protein M1822_004645 [Bathelium mastoideum]